MYFFRTNHDSDDLWAVYGARNPVYRKVFELPLFIGDFEIVLVGFDSIVIINPVMEAQRMNDILINKPFI